jgi:peptidyl-prolyl cis-trans isomerase SurA
MNKLYRLLAWAAFLLFAAATPSWGEIVDRVIAVVNDDIITQYELESTVDLVLSRYGQNIRPENRERAAADARKTLLDRMIDDLLLRQEAKKLGITVRDEEINISIQENLKRRKMSMEDLQQALVKEGSSYEKYREATRNDLIKSRAMQREIRPRISVTNEEIGAFYLEHRDEYEGRLRVRLQMIFLPVPVGGDPAVKEQQSVKAQAILKRIRAGEPFEALANEFTPASARTGGDIGYVEKGSLNPAIEEVAFGLNPGEMSDVIETPQGIYIIRALDRRGGGSPSVKATREDVEERLYRDKMEKKYAEWLAERRQKAHIDIRL